jgi:hypothetical protein
VWWGGSPGKDALKTATELSVCHVRGFGAKYVSDGGEVMRSRG